MDDDWEDTADAEARGQPHAKELHGQPVCPFCGDTLFLELNDDGTIFCPHDGIDIWVPRSLR